MDGFSHYAGPDVRGMPLMSLPSGALVAIQVIAISGRVVRVRVEGELDLASAPELRTALGREVCAGSSVVLDLAGVAFMDCAGLGAIVSAAEEARRDGGDLRLASAVPGHVRRLIELVGARDGLPVADHGRPVADAGGPLQDHGA